MVKSSLYLVVGGLTATNALSFSIPASPPSNASPQLVAAPVGVSFEFFTYPAYFENVTSTTQCLKNLQQLSGTWPPIRIGGTTQDRATYNSSLAQPVSYTVADPADAPTSLTYGPSFITLAGQYQGNVTLGLNRELNNQANTIQAAQLAVSDVSKLYAIELGNEPNFYSASSPIAGGSWSASKDVSSQVSWQQSVGKSLSKSPLIQAGVYFGTGSYSIASLAASEGNSLAYVKSFCSHNYPQSGSTANLAQLMSHSAIASQIAQYKSEQQAAASHGKDYVIGETNSATQGGGGISPTFGAALWIVDYVLQSLIQGVKALYFHQGTIGNCQYCWWGRYSMGTPFYGAYFAALALANADKIALLDSAGTNYAAYAIYKNNVPTKVLLYNSDYYTSGTRPSQSFTLSGIPASATSVTAKRLTAPYATSRQDQGQNPTVAGQTFANGTCVVQGVAKTETTAVVGGSATFAVAASEALLVYL